MSKSYKPLMNLVIVKREIKDKVGSIHIPESAKHKMTAHEGEVLQTGPEVTLVEPGQKIVFGSFSGTWLDEKQSLFIVSDEDILAVIEE